MSDQTPRTFDPSRFLTLVSGREYLEVKWRLVWFRSEHPNGVIETHLVSHQNSEAIFKAQVSTGRTVDPETGEVVSGGSATGWGSEDAQGFGDYLAKAETKAIGRALAALGYGTQFCGDFEFGAAGGRVVDAPVDFNSRRPQGGAQKPATERQRNLIQALAREQKIAGPALDQLCTERTGQPFATLSSRDASTVIEYLRANQPAVSR